MYGTATAAPATRAATILAGDRIIVNLPANGKGRKHTVSETFDSEGFRINGIGARIEDRPALDLSKVNAPSQVVGPVFPMGRYKAALEASGTPNSDAVQAINNEYLTAVAAFKKSNPAAGTQQLGDKVAEAVLAWVGSTYGIKLTATTGDYESINPAAVATNMPNRAGTEPVVFSVTLMPTWGNR